MRVKADADGTAVAKGRVVGPPKEDGVLPKVLDVVDGEEQAHPPIIHG